jgi:hypothetical protein
MNFSQVIVLSTFILAVCFISLIPFSQSEGYSTMEALTSTSGNTASSSATVTQQTTVKTETPATIQSNTDFLTAVNNALSASPDVAKDKISIYNLQGKISSLKSKNSATLLGEIGNPNNLNNPRLFLKYMNWFGSNCPIDSDACPGLQK